jgi:hypothetical protein
LLGLKYGIIKITPTIVHFDPYHDIESSKKINTGKIEKWPGTDESSTFSPREYWIVSDKW